MGEIPRLIAETLPTETYTDSGSIPLTEIELSGCAKLTDFERMALITVKNSIYTASDTDKCVVIPFVGLIGTAYDFAILVAIVVLLSAYAEREEETCCCKSSKKFNTFHNNV